MNINEIEVIDKIGEDYIDYSIEAINAHQIWRLTEGEGVSIAVIDTGIDTTHPEFEGRIVSQFNMVEKSRDVTDEYGHGSHVAGLLVGMNTGVAPMADLHVIKVLDGNGRGSIANIMDGITHAMNLKADVLCISLGGAFDIPLILKQRISDAVGKGLTIVSAVGNSGKSEAFYPARMDNVIAVGGLDEDLNLATFSNMGYDVLAPSTRILSTYKDNNYARMTGTSMATPLVAGAVALLISYYRKQGKNLTPREIKAMLKGKLDLTKIIG